MDQEENYFLSQNKYLEDKIEYCLHNIECRLDKLYKCNEDDVSYSDVTPDPQTTNQRNQPVAGKNSSPYSSHTLLTFKSPYIRDFRNFSSPVNEDVRQIQQLTGTENIDLLIKNKNWTKEVKQQLKEAVLDYYSKIHIIKLIKQKNQLLQAPSKQNDEDVAQKLRLIEEQTEQVKIRKELRIFVPEDRLDSQIDWCAISAKISSPHDAHDCRLMWSNSLHWSINDKYWTKEEDVCLINAVEKYGRNDWDLVAKELNSGRLAWQCCSRYNQEYASITSPIEKDDTDKIIEVINLCRIGSFVPWNQVMYFIQYYNLHQVKYQWHRYCSEQQGGTNWTPSEDLLLIRAVEKYGEKDWRRIAECVPSRSNKSCRERYIMRLKFNKRAVGSWRRGEDMKLMSLVERFGTNWSLISDHLPERNCHQLRNRFELLKNDAVRIGPIKHRKLYKNSDGQLVNSSFRRKRLTAEIEINQKLHEIFSTYLSANKNSSKSLTCRSGQDEVIYQCLIKVLCDIFLGREREYSLLETIINKAVEQKPGLLMPCVPTLGAYKAWTLQQDYLNQYKGTNNDQDDTIEIDHQILKIIVSIFLWPAILSRLKRPDVNVNEYLVGSMIERDSKNLYRIRDIQRQITRH